MMARNRILHDYRSINIVYMPSVKTFHLSDIPVL
nr:MAG TPA: Protein of unknown function DUF86 [Caudoviricetes sp.]